MEIISALDVALKMIDQKKEIEKINEQIIRVNKIIELAAKQEYWEVSYYDFLSPAVLTALTDKGYEVTYLHGYGDGGKTVISWRHVKDEAIKKIFDGIVSTEELIKSGKLG